MINLCALFIRSLSSIHMVERIHEEKWDVLLKEWVPAKYAITEEDLKPRKIILVKPEEELAGVE